MKTDPRTPNEVSPAIRPKPNAISVWLHWIFAGAILVALLAGIQAVYNSPMWAFGQRRYYFLLHAYAGLFVLGLVVLRLFFRALFPWPGEPKGASRLAKLAAGATHLALYVLSFVIPVNGWIVASSFACCVGVPGLPDINLLSTEIRNAEPADAAVAYNLHRVLPWILLALIILHVAAALFHHFVVRDETLTSMLPGPARRRRRQPLNEIDPQSKG